MRRWLVALGVVVVVGVVAVTLARRAPEPVGDARAPTTGSALGTGSEGSAEPASTAATTTEATTETTTTTLPALPAAAPRADPPRFPTTVAVAANPAISVRDAPDGRQFEVLRSPAPYSRMPQIFTVVPDPGAPLGWLHVALRTRPNQSTGWIRASDVGLDQHNWSIDINLTDRWATIYDRDAVFAATPVVIGTAASPTPVGDFFVAEGVWTGQANGVYGPFVYGLSAHSDVYTEFGGGDGQIGLHGTNQPGLLGTAASHGCVRFPNAIMLRLAKTLPMGVPVHIHR